MKYSATIIFVISLVLSMGGTLSSCDFSENGDLDGVWHVTRLDSVQTNYSSDVRDQLLTWSFQAHILQFFNHRQDAWEKVIMARFENTGEQLIVYDPFIYNRMEGDVHLTADSTQYLTPHFINSLPDTFNIEILDKNKFQISDNMLRLYFEKY